MEIFRIDGGGRTENPTRLIKIIAKVFKHIPETSGLWKNIKSISDHKGVLTITLFDDFIDSMDETFLLYQFMVAWDAENEDANNVLIKYERGQK